MIFSSELYLEIVKIQSFYVCEYFRCVLLSVLPDGGASWCAQPAQVRFIDYFLLLRYTLCTLTILLFLCFVQMFFSSLTQVLLIVGHGRPRDSYRHGVEDPQPRNARRVGDRTRRFHRQVRAAAEPDGELSLELCPECDAGSGEALGRGGAPHPPAKRKHLAILFTLSKS